MSRLFHVSDVHFGAEDREAIDWFGAAVAVEKPDAVIMTGDLTMRARSAEFLAGGEWLKSLGVPVTVEVGNHDLPLHNPFARFLRPYRRYRAIETMIERPLDLPDVAIVPLKTTARFQWRLNWSKGHVSRGSLRAALAMVAAKPAGKLAFVACHHPLIDANTRSRALTRRGSEALNMLARAGADAVLSGHVHDPFDLPYDLDGRTVRLVGAGTLSERTRATRPSFNDIRIDGRDVAIVHRMMD